MLPRHVWNFEQVLKRVTPQRIKVVERACVRSGSYPLNGDDRYQVQFHCPKRFGFNIATFEFTGPVAIDRPVGIASNGSRPGLACGTSGVCSENGEYVRKYAPYSGNTEILRFQAKCEG